MIKKTIIVFIILFGVYTFIILLNPSISATQHQWQDNIVRAEKYIYDESDTINNLIVGSSLSLLIRNDSLRHFYNLAFAAQSFYEGLEIVSHKKKLPKNIFIETNFVFKEQNKAFSSGLFSFLNYNIKKYCISLRSDKQPLVFIYPAIKKEWQMNKNEFEKNKKQPSVKEIQESEIFKKLLKLQLANYAKIPDSTFVSNQFLLLTSMVTELKSKGVNIIFFEMPINPNLVELPLAKLIRNSFYKYFPVDQNNYIKMPDCSNYITGDGLHLEYEESITYTSYFKKEAKKYSF